MTYFFDTQETLKSGSTIDHRGRVYKVTDKKGNFLWWEASAVSRIDGEVLAESVFSDFKNGEYIGLSSEDKAKALTRKAKI